MTGPAGTATPRYQDRFVLSIPSFTLFELRLMVVLNVTSRTAHPMIDYCDNRAMLSAGSVTVLRQDI
jgi:hypothetical protein